MCGGFSKAALVVEAQGEANMRDTQIHNSEGDGALICGDAYLTFNKGNRISRCRAGVVVEGEGHLVMGEQNKVELCKQQGVLAQAGAALSLHNATFQKNGGAGIEIAGKVEGAELRGNRVYQNKGCAILVSGTHSSGEIRENWLMDNGGAPPVQCDNRDHPRMDVGNFERYAPEDKLKPPSA